MVDRQVMHRIARLCEIIFDALEVVIGAEEGEAVAEEAYHYEDPA
ncbi:hypothetical protein [Streptomyces sp. L2]|nr:hypothetical protein [Streptomyces sp. L2]